MDKSRVFRLVIEIPNLSGLEMLGEILNSNFGEKYLEDEKSFDQIFYRKNFVFIDESKYYNGDVSEDFKFDSDKLNSIAAKIFSRDEKKIR